MDGYLPYIILGVILILTTVLEVFSYDKYSKWNTKVLYIILVLTGSLFMTRWYVGWDWYNYKLDFYSDIMSYEYGYRLFVQIIRGIYPNFNFFVGVNTVVDFLLIGYILKKYSPYPILTFFLYLGIVGLSLEIDIMRNVKSILLFLISLQFIEKNKPFHYFIINVIGILFHVSAIVYLPLYFLLKVNINKKYILIVFIIGVIYYISNATMAIDIIDKLNIERLNGYKTYFLDEEREISIFFIERVVLFACVFFGSGFIEEKYKKIYTIIENSAYISIFIFLFSSELLIMSLRVSLLFFYSYWFIFPLLLKNLELNKLARGTVFIIAMLIVTFRSYNFLNFKGNQMVYKYENIFFKNTPLEDKEERWKEARKYNNDGVKRELLLQY